MPQISDPKPSAYQPHPHRSRDFVFAWLRPSQLILSLALALGPAQGSSQGSSQGAKPQQAPSPDSRHYETHYETKVPTGLGPQISAAELEVLKREQSRDFEPSFFAKALNSSDSKVVIRALLAMGRIGDPSALALITPLMTDSDYKKSRAAVAAAGWLGDADAFAPLRKAYSSTNIVAVKTAAAKAMAAIAHPESLTAIEGYMTKANHPALRAGLSEALGHSFYRHKDLAKAKISKATWLKLLSQLKSTSPEVARGSAFALYMAARKKAEVPKWVLKEVESDIASGVSATVKAAKTGTSARGKASDGAKSVLDPYATAYLIKLTSLYSERRKGLLYPLLSLPVNQAVQVEAARAVFAAPKGSVQSKKIANLLADKRTKPAVKAALIDALAKRGKASAVVSSALSSLADAPSGSDDSWVKDRAIIASVKLAPQKQRLKRATAFLSGPHRKAGLAAFRHVPIRAGLPTLIALSKGQSLDDAKEALQVIDSLDGKKLAALTKSPLPKTKGKAGKASKDSKNPWAEQLASACSSGLSRNDMVVTYYCASIIKKLGLAHLAPKLQAAYQRIQKLEEFEAKVAILKALGSFTGKTPESFLAEAVKDGNPAVRKEALAIAKKKGMKQVVIEGQNIAAHRITLSNRALSLSQINSALASTMVFKTAKGSFVIKPDVMAPLTSSYISSLAQSNFYKGLSFHRIIPNFVVQGGDPRGDGWGGADRINPDEFQLVSHKRGSVGIATAGKDTGSCQFFVNLAPNIWLDGRYTTFGEVVSGMAVIDRLTPGDVILSSSVTSGLSH